MSIFPTKAHRLALLCFALLLTFSCSKDSDLLADYVNPGSLDGQLRRFVVDDTFRTSVNASIRMNVLSNDNFPEEKKVRIKSTSNPRSGNVSINEDNTITYEPTGPAETTDSFDYTTEVVNEDASVSEETATVTVTISEMGDLKAFPGAEGFGKQATGGRGGTVVEVTNLNDDGPGSLREALTMTGSRTIIFKVGGTIECKSVLTIPSNSGNVTIAGQTAPGDGIAIKGAELRIQASNVIIRYLRIRPGSSTTETNEDGVRIIAYSGNTTENVILDHLSITWGKDENVEIGGIGDQSSVNNVTVQNSIIAENIRTKYGLLLWNRATNISIYKNLFAHNSERNIRSSTCSSDFEMINNVVYGYRSGTHPTYENHFSIIGNVYKVNPKVATSGSTIKLEASLNNCPNGIITNTLGFIDDNLLDENSISLSSTLNSYLRSSPVINSGIIPLSSSITESEVFKSVGASLPHSDAVDLRLINDAKNKTGNLTDIETGGYPVLSVGSPYIDNDKDGISDEWEIAHGLNPASSNDGSQDANGDGYTNLEDFLHSLTL